MKRLLKWLKRLIVSIFVLAILGFVLFYVLTSSDGLSITVPAERYYVRDDPGRALLLHGVNDDGCAM